MYNPNLAAGLYIVATDGVSTPVNRFSSLALAEADAEARTLASGNVYVVYKALVKFEMISTPSLERTDLL